MKEHNNELSDVFTTKKINESRKNCVDKLINYIKNMEQKGQWLLVQELKDTHDWRSSPNTKIGKQPS